MDGRGCLILRKIWRLEVFGTDEEGLDRRRFGRGFANSNRGFSWPEKGKNQMMFCRRKGGFFDVFYAGYTGFF